MTFYKELEALLDKHQGQNSSEQELVAYIGYHLELYKLAEARDRRQKELLSKTLCPTHGAGGCWDGH